MVTGALGHIGSHLIRNCNPEHVSAIRMLDNLESQRYVSLVNLPDAFAYRFIQDDIRTADMTRHLDGVDAVVHLAAITNAEASYERQKEVEEVNFQGLRRVAEACKAAGVPLLFPSSTSVYGSQESVVDETCTELKPQSPYADTKLQSEQLLRELGSDGLRFTTCRFGTIFGPSVGMRFHTAVNKFIWQAVHGEPLTVWKTAWQQRRPYLDLNDCVNAINFILENDIFKNDLYNVVTNNHTVEEIVDAIKEHIPQLSIKYVDSPIMNQLSYDVSSEKIRALGFNTSGDLARGVRESIEQFKPLLVR